MDLIGICMDLIIGSIQWIMWISEKPANKAGWKEAVLFYAFDEKTMFTYRKLKNQSIPLSTPYAT
ncbi:hypothetical protein FOK90_22760 [Salmonella enterica]|nr:hypothetical protein [Salmonella enterica]EAW5391779.1 hypothetical protein [Salmonella enterica subsp. enterica serovar Ohio]EBB8914838.1 hypothetical protein [Salmonella enterica]EBC3902069.1 hypothetical protein [Salmonella enterica subsp. enterica serovar Ohio]EBE7511367.1 hypothetical protein [Salmonella enterica]